MHHNTPAVDCSCHPSCPAHAGSVQVLNGTAMSVVRCRQALHAEIAEIIAGIQKQAARWQREDMHNLDSTSSISGITLNQVGLGCGPASHLSSTNSDLGAPPILRPRPAALKNWRQLVDSTQPMANPADAPSVLSTSASMDFSTSVPPYKLGRRIGVGAYGTVHEGTFRGLPCAIKSLVFSGACMGASGNGTSNTTRKTAILEAAVCCVVNHPNGWLQERCRGVVGGGRWRARVMREGVNGSLLLLLLLLRRSGPTLMCTLLTCYHDATIMHTKAVCLCAALLPQWSAHSITTSSHSHVSMSGCLGRPWTGSWCWCRWGKGGKGGGGRTDGRRTGAVCVCVCIAHSGCMCASVAMTAATLACGINNSDCIPAASLHIPAPHLHACMHAYHSSPPLRTPLPSHLRVRLGLGSSYPPLAYLTPTPRCGPPATSHHTSHTCGPHPQELCDATLLAALESNLFHDSHTRTPCADLVVGVLKDVAEGMVHLHERGERGGGGGVQAKQGQGAGRWAADLKLEAEI